MLEIVGTIQRIVKTNVRREHYEALEQYGKLRILKK
jgi:hypothetical protein